jgi:spermidine/putrescine transport system ATP-binding protein
MHGQKIELINLSVKYGNFTAVQSTNLEVKAGEFFSILGPSGCGKTTLLRTISGFIKPSKGQVLIGEKDMADIEPRNRPTALIFQSLALFSLMKVWENVTFGLEARGVAKKERYKRAIDLLDLVALSGEQEKYPSELSGGQMQRVAVARALAVEPSVLLLDEPLASLDLKLRQHMRSELRSIQKKTGVTFIYITHDQGEALTMSDRIAVMNHGIIEQIDTTDNVYDKPTTPFVASFVGQSNVFKGVIKSIADGLAVIETVHGTFQGKASGKLTNASNAMMFVRPEKIRIGGEQQQNFIKATLTRRDLEGAYVNLFLQASGEEIVLHLTKSADLISLNIIDDQSEHIISFGSRDALILPEGELAATGKELAND